jgi:putative addiction module CopG family antidote
MAYQFPPDVAKLVKEQIIAGGYGSEDEVLRDALRVFGEFKARREQLLAEVRAGVDQAERGLARPLDVNALIDRCTLRLAEEGIVD